MTLWPCLGASVWVGQASSTPSPAQEVFRSHLRDQACYMAQRRPPTQSHPQLVGLKEGPGVGISLQDMPGEVPRAQGSHCLPFPCCSCLLTGLLQWSFCIDITLMQPAGADTPNACECLLAGRDMCRCLGRGCSTDSNGQGRDVHPLKEEC